MDEKASLDGKCLLVAGARRWIGYNDPYEIHGGRLDEAPGLSLIDRMYYERVFFCWDKID